ncbi:MAG TPA: ribonuclease HI family protein [Candidatus Paceibacterota bacterium]|nr:ribonuclease HI family protein [Candidatus Paceibacterota bacterium]
MAKVLIYTDGGARGNPGPAGVGAVIFEDGLKVAELKQFIGSRQTNNWAEYEAVHLALQEARQRGLNTQPIDVQLDSMLVAEQLSGHWKIKEPALREQWAKVRTLIAADFHTVRFTYVPREKNTEADRLVNEAIDEAGY